MTAQAIRRAIPARLNVPDWIARPALAFIVTRLIVFFAAYLAEIAIPGVVGDGLYHANPNNVFLDVWARWDSGFYLSIAERGYFFQLGQQSSVAFFPMYPLLMAALTPITGSALAAGVLVSNLALFGALVFLYLLTDLEFEDRATATRAVFYMAAFPTAFFFSAVYTESTFALLAIATMYFARRRLWAWAALFGVLVASTRIVGVVMWGVVGLEWLKVHGWTLSTIHKGSSWRGFWQGLRMDWHSLAIIYLIPLGLISYMLYLNNTFGDPIAFSTTQSAWGREMVGPFVIIYRDLVNLWGADVWRGDIFYHIVVDLAAFALVLFAGVRMWRRLGESYALYSLISVLIPISSGSQSMTRYALVVFPLFMLLGWWGRYELLDRALMVAFSVFLGIFTAIFVNWIFIA
ncbi:MAG: mannosyltransferase family protein [Chloroflexota bacterium]